MDNSIICMLKEQEYSFVSSSTDNEDRFLVIIGKNTESDDVFAFQSGDNIIVSGEGELQMFDVLGRMVSRQWINGMEAISKPSKTGIYILRLKGKEVKSQKIVVR